MKLKAQLMITDRNRTNGGRQDRFVTGCISVGVKNLKEKDPYLLVCTTSNRTGNMYKLTKENVLKVFSRFVNEGKCTFWFKEPPHDISIRANPDSLENFIKSFKAFLMNLWHEPKTNEVKLPLLAPVSTSDISRPKEKLVILQKKDYPFSKGFPSTLKLLVINNINLQRIDTRILKLRLLVNLNLGSCSLTEVPPVWDRLVHLASLELSNNKLETLPSGFCQGNLRHTLQVLDLRSNRFKKLPRYLCNLTTMHTFRVDNNQLSEFPPSVGKMSNLKYLSASNNKMAFFPGSAFYMKVDFLDLSGNYMDWDPHRLLPLPPSKETGFKDLRLIAAQAFLSVFKPEGIPKPGEIPASLVEYLMSFQECLCGTYATDEHIGYGRMGIPDIATTYRIDGSDSVLGRFYMCNPDCQNMFNSIPHIGFL